MFEATSNSVEETIAYGRALSALVQPDDMVVLTGDLGAGKTHFTKGMAAGLGIADDITSPTFNIVIEYAGGRWPLLHFDLYRLDDIFELDDIDFYALTESGAVSLVEWGDKFPEALPDERLHLDFKVDENGVRTLRASGIGPRGLQLEDAFAQTAGSTTVAEMK